MRHIALLLLFLSVFTHAFEFDTNDIFEQIHESEENDDVSMESSEDLESVFDNGLITEEDKENENEESESEDETKLGEKLHEEHTNVYESYVLWRPSILDNSGLLKSQQHFLTFLGNFVSEGQREQDEHDERGGWRGDMNEMDLPRVSALRSGEEPTMYDNLVSTVNNMKEAVNDIASRPDVKNNMSYILMGLMGFMLLMFLNENLSGKSKENSIKNHYLLQDTGAAAKLPTYEECMKTEKNILVSIGDQDAFNKVDLSLPVIAVTKDKGGNI